MAVLTVHSVLAGGSAKPVGILSDLAVGISADGSTILYGISREGLAVSAFNLDASSIPLLDWQSLPAGLSPLGSYGLDLVDLGDGPQAVILATASAGLPSFELGADGSLPGSVSYLADDGLNGEAIAMVAAESGGTQYVYAVGSAGDVVTRYVLGEASNLAGAASSVTPLPDGMTGITALQSGVVSEQAFLFAADGMGDRVGVYKVKTNGDLKLMDDMGAADGLSIDAPSALAQVEVGGQTYLIVAARGSSSLSVLHVDEYGMLSATDHLVDDLTSRFQNVTALDAVVVDGRAYVTAGGADDGLTLFELLPGGRLRVIESVADQVETSLQNVSAVAMAATGEGLEIFAGSGTETGATRVSLALEPGLVLWATDSGTLQGGAGDDLLSDSAGDDDLRGGAGDDVISGGRGADWLEGGAGADVFVILADGVKDRIRDFDPSEDRLDLSHWPMLRSLAQLAVSEQSDGATIAFGAEELRLFSSHGGRLTAQQVLAAITEDFLHFDVSWIGADNDVSRGTEEDDFLQGGSGDDTLSGEGGDDRLEGGAGDDDLSGGDGRDDLFGGDGADTLEGGSGADYLDGGTGDDTLLGEDGNDKLFGRGGADVLLGMDGNDGLIGGGGADLLDGGAGDDVLSSGAGDDQLIGGSGDDVLRGLSGADVLQGDDGNDRLFGNGGADLLEAGSNDDFLDGGGGKDTLKGGGGADVMYGKNGSDVLQGEGGSDTLDGGDGDDILEGGGGADSLIGGHGEDHMQGGGGDDSLYGQGGADKLYGEKGNDILSGGGGKDYLDGGSGDDRLDGGNGEDTFEFTSGHDVIEDFQNNIDTIVLDDALWGGGLTLEEVIDLGEVTSEGDLLFSFEEDHSLRIVGRRYADALINDLEII